MKFTKNDVGYWWVIYKDFNEPYLIELRYVTWDHTRDGDRFVLFDLDVMIEEDEFYHYKFINKIEPPTWPYDFKE